MLMQVATSLTSIIGCHLMLRYQHATKVIICTYILSMNHPGI